MPIPSALLDVAVLLIDASFVGLWALVGMAPIGGGVDLIVEVFRRRKP